MRIAFNALLEVFILLTNYFLIHFFIQTYLDSILQLVLFNLKYIE